MTTPGKFLLAVLLLFCFASRLGAAGEPPSLMPRDLTLDQCLDLALRQNPSILKAKQELQRTYGLIVEARAPAVPQITASGQYSRTEAGNVNQFPFPPSSGLPTMFNNQEQPWLAQIEVSQLVYAGGRVTA